MDWNVPKDWDRIVKKKMQYSKLITKAVSLDSPWWFKI